MPLSGLSSDVLLPGLTPHPSRSTLRDPLLPPPADPEAGHPEIKKKRARVASRLVQLAQEENVLLWLGVFFVFVSSALDSAVPYFSGGALSAVEDEAFLHFVKGLVIMSLLGAFCSSGRVYCLALIEVRLVERLRARLLANLLRQETLFFDAHSSGELTSRLTSDVTMLSSSLTTNVNLIGQNATNLLTSLAVMLAIDWQLASVFGLCSLVFFAGTKAVGNMQQKNIKAVLEATAEANSRATQALSLLRVVRTLAGEEGEASAYASAVKSVRLKDEKTKLVWTVYVPTVSTINLGLLLLVLFYGHAKVRTPAAALSFTSFFLYTSRLQGALSGMATNFASFIAAIGAGQEVFALIDREPLSRTTGGVVPEGGAAGARGALAFESVTFGYPSRPEPVVTNISLAVPPGGRVALVGPSGAGKSTLLNLALRLYDPQGGRITLDGVDIGVLDPTYLRTVVGIVTQEPPLLAGTLRDNILFASPPGSEARLDEAVALAQLGAVLRGLEHGLDTSVGERGARLSGGQKQRVAIARAVVRDPALLLLDEATSALDGASEAAVASGLERHLAGRQPHPAAMLVVAHRLSTVRHSNLIVVLHKGGVAEAGTYEELVALKGLFYALLETQMQTLSAAMGDDGEK